jgi:hypothetical protein
VKDRRDIIYKKLFAFGAFFSLLALVVALINHYLYYLNSYCYTAEFYLLFVLNNLKAGNLEVFKDCLTCMSITRLAFPMVLFSHLIQNFWLPFTKQILASAAVSSYGVGIGGILTYLSFLFVGMISFGLGIFFLGDIVPYLTKKNGNVRVWLNHRSGIPFTLLFAVPYFPILIPGILGGLFRIPLGKFCRLIVIAFGIRLVWLVTFPQMFP